MTMFRTIEEIREEVFEQTDTIQLFAVILINDDLNEIDYVISKLAELFGFDAATARERAYHTHNYGLCLLRVCPLEHAEHFLSLLEAEGLVGQIVGES